MPGPHDRIIADAAKTVLRPIGFRRKGRSRTWLADHSWWLAVVEFQPSAWSKGSYLNVAAHWLWSATGNLSFDFGGRIQEFVEYQSDGQFAPAAAQLAERAAEEAQRLRGIFPSLEATANILLDEENAGGWVAYNAGVAAALVGRVDAAADLFNRILNMSVPSQSLLHQAAEQMAGIATDKSKVRREVVELITRQRDALGLPALSAPPL